MLELAVGIGLFINMVFTELLGIAAGGMVVPGYIALSLDQPWRVATTVGISLLVFWLIRFLSRFMLIYGRRHLVLAILLGYIATMAMARVASLEYLVDAKITLHAVGMVVPGLIAYWMERQGVIETFSCMMIGSVATKFLLIVCTGGRVFVG
jgi:poly-gamma-glutamate biosynthesis protein PgsC/CapC